MKRRSLLPGFLCVLLMAYASAGADSLQIRFKVKLLGKAEHPVLVRGDSLVAGTNLGYIYRISRTDGVIRWLNRTFGKVTSAPVLYHGQLVFTSYEDRNLDDLSLEELISWKPVSEIEIFDFEDGKSMWRRRFDGIMDEPASISDGNLYVGYWTRYNEFSVPAVLGFNILKRQILFSTQVRDENLGLYFMTPRPGLGLLYTIDGSQNIYAIRTADGKTSWFHHSKGDAAVFPHTSLLYYDKVLFGSGNHLVILSLDGKVIKTLDIQIKVLQDMVRIGDRLILKGYTGRTMLIRCFNLASGHMEWVRRFFSGKTIKGDEDTTMTTAGQRITFYSSINSMITSVDVRSGQLQYIDAGNKVCSPVVRHGNTLYFSNSDGNLVCGTIRRKTANLAVTSPLP